MFVFLNRYLRPRWPHVLLLAALVLGNEGVNLLFPQVVRFFIDTARAGREVGGGAHENGALETLLVAGALFLGVALVNQVVGLCESTVASNLGWHATNDLRADLAGHVLRLDMPFHNAHTPGELIERVDGDTGILRNFFSRFVVMLLGGVLFLVGVLFMLWREDWRVALFTTVTSAIALGVLVWGRLIGIRYSIATRQANAEVTGFLEERLGGLPDIRGNALQSHTVSRMEGLIRVWLARVRAMLLIGIGIGVSSTVVRIVTMVLTLAGVARLFGAGAISLGTAYLLVHYAQETQSTVRQIARQLEDFQRASAALRRVRELEEQQPAGNDPTESIPLPNGPLAVEFDHVTFAYAQAPVVHDISFRVDPGRMLGIIGRTGSGKTTLGRLIFRLYDAPEGTVRLGGVDVRHVRQDDLHRRVAMVTQEVQLFYATLRDNVALFDHRVDDDRITAVLDDVGLGDWRRALPDGLDTMLEAGHTGTAAGLSAGEAQLLAFARVFLRDPSVVVLDEASSRLDPATEARLERAIDRLMWGRTALVIAHRLRTVQRADDILVLHDERPGNGEAGAQGVRGSGGGRVAEHGRRAALAADHTSHYARLLRAGGLGASVDDALAATGVTAAPGGERAPLRAEALI